MITENHVIEAFDNLEKAFQDLAKIEDKQQTLAQDLAEYKDGSRKADQIKKHLQEMQPKLAETQRMYRLAGMRVDRVRLLLDVEKNARGTD